MIATALTALAISGSWVGTFVLPAPGADRIAMSVDFRGARASVSLQQGHAVLTDSAVRTIRGRVRFQVPGRPAPVIFNGRAQKRSLKGTVTQGSIRGTFTLRRGAPLQSRLHGLYSLAPDRWLAVGDDQFLPMRAVELDSGEARSLYRRTAGTYDVGGAIGVRQPLAGEARFALPALTWALAGRPAEQATRIPLRQEEVRFRSGNTTLAGTLTLPPGAGPHPALAIVHGSGDTPRSFGWTFRDFYVRLGIAVLTYDKRGLGQSGGSYAGEAATEANIDQLSRDAEAAARFLAAQPDIDRARIGLSGASQAGWIMPRAAAREPAIRFLVLLVSPLETVEENNTYQELSGEGAAPSTLPPEQIDAQVKAQRLGGVASVPWIRQLRIPALWVYGGNDMHVATRISIERLAPIAAEPGRDFSWVVFPSANHGLLETARGLNEEALRATRYAPGVFSAIRGWLRARGLASAP